MSKFSTEFPVLGNKLKKGSEKGMKRSEMELVAMEGSNPLEYHDIYV